MDIFLAALEGLAPIQALRFSRWGYAAVNTAHVLSLATLFGAILALDLRLLGLWRTVPVDPLLRVLPRVAAIGLALAALTGLALFATRARGYAELDVFRLKMLFVVLGTGAALVTACLGGLRKAAPTPRRVVGAFSLACWTGALVSGRMIAFAGE